MNPYENGGMTINMGKKNLSFDHQSSYIGVCRYVI